MLERLVQQIAEAETFRDVDGNGRPFDPQGRQTGFTIDQQPGDQYVQDVDQQNALHRNAGLSVAMHDGGKYVDTGGPDHPENTSWI